MRFNLILALIILFVSCNRGTLDNNSNENPSQQAHKEHKALPADESTKDPGLADFINRLKAIVLQKDTSALFSILDTAVVVSCGGALYGKKAFREQWKLDDPAESELWESLQRILQLGGVFETADDNREIFNIPYANSNKAYGIIDSDYDCYNTAVCINPYEPVFGKNDFHSKIIAYLQYDFVIFPDDSQREGQLVEIQTFNREVEGFVASTSLIRCADPKLNLQKDREGRWRIIAYAPYD